MTPVKNLKGIRGWLILVAINLITTPVCIIFNIFSTYYKLFNNTTLTEIAEFLSYEDPTVLYFFFAELVANIVLIVLFILAAYWFFKTNYRFPKFYIFLLISFSLLLLVDTLAFFQLFEGDFAPLSQREDRETLLQIIRTCIWIPYMLCSKRVKNTFVAGQYKNNPSPSIVM